MTRMLSKLLASMLLLIASNFAHADKVTYIYTDPQGTPIAEADEQGNITKTFDYRPYGEQALGQPPDGPGYTGHVNDPDTGLVYMQARYYDPELGRFLSVDPVGPKPEDTFGFNRYAYAQNNPIVNIDPDGRWVCNGSDTQCSGFEQALGTLKDAASSQKLTASQRNTLSAIVGLYGEKGDDRVQISFIPGDGLQKGGESLRKDGGVLVTFVSSSTESRSSLLDYGRNVAHEGQHGVDDIDQGRPDANRTERMQSELNAYTAQAYFQKAHEIQFGAEDGWNFSKGIDQNKIQNQASRSVEYACQGIDTGSCAQ